MGNWTEWVASKQTGYPVINITWESDSRLSLNQERFLYSNKTNLPDTWLVPISIVSGKNMDKVDSFILDSNSTTIDAAADTNNGFMKVNYDTAGFYRVNYPKEHWKNLSELINKQLLKPTDPYGAGKAAADLMCQSYSESFGLPITVIRSSALFGPNSRLQQVIPIFIQQALKGNPITIEGDGSQSTDFNYVQNLVDAIVSMSESNINGVYNIAYGKDYSIKDIADLIIKQTNSKSEIRNLPWLSLIHI